MLWDCRFCGTKRLLGLTHRHCPNCGGPQNSEERYFPSDAEKVPVQNHVYFGADVLCAHCGAANSKNAKHCGGCGAPLEGARDVARRQDQVVGAGETFAGQSSADARRERTGAAQPVAAPTAPPKSSAGRFIAVGCLTVIVIGIAFAAVLVLWKRDNAFSVTGHTWKREIAIEQLGPVSESSWCESTPADARGVSRRREVRSHEQVRDGETCRTRKVDNGNGTFSEHQECTPKYRDEPVYGDKCYYTVNRWHVARSASAQGASLADSPRWPAAALGSTEREGARTETYTVDLQDSAAKQFTCDFDQQKWQSLADGTKLKGETRVLTGGVDCASLH
jgi:hypothetical protein